MRIEDFLSGDSITELLASIRQAFPVKPLLTKDVPIAYANGDDWSVQKIANILNHRPWDDIFFEEFLACGADELKSYLSARAFFYYLPGLMVCCLGALQLASRMRLHEVSTLMLLPTTADFQDVWEYFGDGMLDNWGTPFFSKFARDLIDKIKYVHESSSTEQRECVARYIEIVESYGVDDPTPEFLALLKKYTDFWRHASVKSS